MNGIFLWTRILWRTVFMRWNFEKKQQNRATFLLDRLLIIYIKISTDTLMKFRVINDILIKKFLHKYLYIILYALQFEAVSDKYFAFYKFFEFCLRWSLQCLLKLETSEKHLEQTLHIYGFSPVWVLTWRWKLQDKYVE